MRLHAFLKDNKVIKVESVENVSSDEIREYQLVIDIEDDTSMPQVGWILDGNKLLPNSSQSLSIPERAKLQQTHQRLFGEKLAKELVDLVGAKNLELSMGGNSPNVASLLSSLGGILSLLQTGALKTARGIMVSSTAAFPAYSEVFSLGVSEISSFLEANEYE